MLDNYRLCGGVA